MKPSWAVMKLTLASGPRSSVKTWFEPARRRASDPMPSLGMPSVAPAGDVAQPEVAHPIAEPVVPLRPAAREAADLPAAVADVPRLGDHLDALERGVGDDRLEQRMLRIELAALVAPERRGQVEAEPVDLHVVRPVAQRVEHEPLGRRPARSRGCCRIP